MKLWRMAKDCKQKKKVAAQKLEKAQIKSLRSVNNKTRLFLLICPYIPLSLTPRKTGKIITLLGKHYWRQSKSKNPKLKLENKTSMMIERRFSSSQIPQEILLYSKIFFHFNLTMRVANLGSQAMRYRSLQNIVSTNNYTCCKINDVQPVFIHRSSVVKDINRKENWS